MLYSLYHLGPVQVLFLVIENNGEIIASNAKRAGFAIFVTGKRDDKLTLAYEMLSNSKSFCHGHNRDLSLD